MKLAVFFFILGIGFLSAQIDYFEMSNGDILNVFELEKLKKSLSDDGQVVHKVLKKRISGDSIISKVKLVIYENDPQGAYFDPFAVHRKMIGSKFPLEQFIDSSTSSGFIKGRPTLINFWFTNCAPCIAEIPQLNNLEKTFKGQANFIAVTFDKKLRVDQFIKRKPFNYTHITDKNKELDLLKIQAYPMNIMLDKNGIVVQVYGDVINDYTAVTQQLIDLSK